MKSLILLTSVLFLFVLTSKAQNVVDNTVNKANNSISSVGTSASNVSNTATNAANTVGTTAGQLKDVGNKLGIHLGKKHMASDDVVSTTEITVEGATYASLKKLDAVVKDCPGVQDCAMKFNSSGSTITVTHTGTTDALLAALQKKSPDIKDNQIADVETGKIDLKLQ